MQTKVLVMDGKSVKEKLRSLGVNLAELATKLGYDNDQRLHSQLKAADVKSGLLEDVARAIGCDVSLFYGAHPFLALMTPMQEVELLLLVSETM